MVNQETGVAKAEFSMGDVDYAQGGTIMIYLQDALADWHNDLAESLKQAGFDMRLVPDFENPLGRLIDIEKMLAE